MGRVCQQGWCVVPDVTTSDGGNPTDASGASLDASSCQVTVDNQENATLDDDEENRLEWTHLVGAGNNRLLVVGIAFRAAEPNTTVERLQAEDADFTLVRADGIATVARSELWALADPPSGLQEMELRFDGTAAAVVVGSLSFFNVDLTDTKGTPRGATGTNRDASVAVPSSSGDLVVGVMSALGGGTDLTSGAGLTEPWNVSVGNGNNGVSGAGGVKPGATSVAMDWTIGGNSVWAITAASVPKALDCP